VNPERDIDIGALQVHGISLEQLADKPKFAEIADELLEFIEGSELLIHNAAFDVGFLNAELMRLGKPRLDVVCRVSDTLAMAREIHPGKRCSLDALCERYAVDSSKRTLHGALLDAQLLCDVWLAMTRGQDALDIVVAGAAAEAPSLSASGEAALIPVLRANDAELAEHAAMCARIDTESKGRCLWLHPPIPA
jgi:DNA polymerase-3 subunit epsilon